MSFLEGSALAKGARRGNSCGVLKKFSLLLLVVCQLFGLIGSFAGFGGRGGTFWSSSS